MWGKHITAPMPLEVLQKDFVGDQSSIGRPPIATPFERKAKKMLKVEKAHFNKFEKISAHDKDDEFLGFFSIVMSYVLSSKDQENLDEGPKHALPIMPRTDHVTMYREFIAHKLVEHLKCYFFIEIIEKLATHLGSKPARATDDKEYTFKWKKQTPSGSEKNKIMFWSSKAGDLATGTLHVKTWIEGLVDGQDRLSAMDDLLRSRQIGGLGSKVSNYRRVLYPLRSTLCTHRSFF